MTNIKKRVAVLVVCAALTAGAVASLSACSADSSAEAEQPVDTRVLVETGTPQIGDIVVQGEFIGTVVPEQQLVVYPKAAGEVLAVNFAVGDTVQAGDVLAQIDSKVLRQNIAKTEAALSLGEQKAKLGVEMAEKNLATAQENVKSGNNSALMQAENAVEQAENGVEAAELALKVARRKLREHRDMDEDEFLGTITGMQSGLTYDQMDTQLRDAVAQAENSMERAQLALSQAKAGLESAQTQTEQGFDSAEDEIEMARLNADLTEARLSLQMLRDDLENYNVTTSIGGVVEQCNVSVYDMVSQQVPLFVISNKDIFSITFTVSESSLSAMRVGDSVTVDKNGTTFPATISEISTMVDERTGLYPVKALVEHAPVALNSGSMVKVYANTEKAENDLIIPIDALYYDQADPYVYVVQNGFATKVPVETGISDDDNIQILSGLSATDEIVLTWSSGLADGAEIALPEESASPAASETDLSATSQPEEENA